MSAVRLFWGVCCVLLCTRFDLVLSDVSKTRRLRNPKYKLTGAPYEPANTVLLAEELKLRKNLVQRLLHRVKPTTAYFADSFATPNPDWWVYQGAGLKNTSRYRYGFASGLWFTGSSTHLKTIRTRESFSSGISIVASLLKNSSCANHYIAIASDPDFTWKWGATPGAVKFVWNCDSKYLYTETGSRVAPCAFRGGYNLNITVLGSVVSFGDDRCAPLTLPAKLATAPFYIHIGADAGKQRALFRSLQIQPLSQVVRELESPSRRPAATEIEQRFLEIASHAPASSSQGALTPDGSTGGSSAAADSNSNSSSSNSSAPTTLSDDFSKRRDDMWQYPDSVAYTTSYEGGSVLFKGRPIGVVPMRLNSALAGVSSTVQGSVDQFTGCGNHFVVLSTEPQLKFAGFTPTPRSVVMGWTCTDKVLITPAGQQRVACPRHHDGYQFKVRISHGRVKFVDEKCPALGIASPFKASARVALYVGADASAGLTSNAAGLRSFTVESNFTKLQERVEETPVFQDSLASFNDSRWDYGDAKDSGPFSISYARGGAAFAGSPTGRTPPRARPGFLSGLRLDINVERPAAPAGQCSNHFIALSKRFDFKFSDFAPSPDTVLLGFQCASKVGFTPKEQLTVPCPPRGNLRVRVTTDGSISFGDGNCGNMSLPNPFPEGTSLYLFIGAAPTASSTTPAPFSNLRVYGSISSILAPEPKPQLPVLQDALFRPNATNFDYGDAQPNGGAFSYKFNAGLSFAGAPLDRTPVRLFRGLINGFSAKVDASLNTGCANLFLAVTTDYSMKWKALGNSEGALLLGWNCGSKELYSAKESRKAQCAATGDFVVDLSTADGKITFKDSQCPPLTLANPFAEGDTVYLFLGAAPQPSSNKENSRFSNLRIFGHLSNVTIATPEPEVPAASDALTAPKAGEWDFGDASASTAEGPLKYAFSPAGLTLYGDAPSRIMPRLESGWMNGVKLSVTVGKQSNCANQFLLLSTEHDLRWQALQSTPNVVQLGWNCGSKELYSAKESRVTPCRDNRDYKVTVDTFGGSITFTDDKCSKLTVANPFDAEDTLYVYLGAAPVPARPSPPSPFSNLNMYGTRSNVTIAAPPPAVPVFSDPLSAPNASAWHYGDCGTDGNFTRAFIDNGLVFRGSPAFKKPARLQQGYMNGLKVTVRAFKQEACANQFLVLTTDAKYVYRGTRPTKDAVMLGWHCDDKQLHGAEQSKSAPCGHRGDYDLSLTTDDGKVTFADSRCPTLSVANPFSDDDTLYLFLGADAPDGHSAGSRFEKLRLFGAASSVPPPKDPPPPPPPPAPVVKNVTKPKPKPLPPTSGILVPDTLPQPKPVLQSTCSAHDDCGACTAKPECGWCPSSGACLQGTSHGPTPQYDGPVPQVEDPVKAFMYAANCTSWDYTFCSATPCSDHTSCGSCLADSFCGWCAGTGKCTEGDMAGSIGEHCPRGWVHSPLHAAVGAESSSTQILTPLMVSIRDGHVHELCAANDASLKNAVQDKMEAEAEEAARLKRLRESCGVCAGVWPHCDCGGNVQENRTAPLHLHTIIRQVDEAVAVVPPGHAGELAEAEAEMASESDAEEARKAEVEGRPPPPPRHKLPPPPPPPPAPKKKKTKRMVPKPRAPGQVGPTEYTVEEVDTEAVTGATGTTGGTGGTGTTGGTGGTGIAPREACGAGTRFDAKTSKCVVDAPEGMESVGGKLVPKPGLLPADPAEAGAQSEVKVLLTRALGADNSKLKDIMLRIDTVLRKADAAKAEEEKKALQEHTNKLDAQRKAQEALAKKLEAETAAARANLDVKQKQTEGGAQKQADVAKAQALETVKKKEDLKFNADQKVALDKQEIASDSAAVVKATSDSAQAVQEAKDARDYAMRQQQAGNIMGAQASTAQAEVLERRAKLLTDSVKAAQDRVDLKKAKLLTDVAARDKAYAQVAAGTAEVVTKMQAALKDAEASSKQAQAAEQSVMAGGSGA